MAAKIISIIPPVLPSAPLVSKNIGAPIAPAMLKHMTWRFVRFSIKRVFTSVKSFGIDTYAAMKITSLSSVRQTQILKLLKLLTVQKSLKVHIQEHPKGLYQQGQLLLPLYYLLP